MKNRFLNAGFTMIELLVVIAIIGVLAAAVLSAINPVEQINKGRDTKFRSDAAELVNASERYFAVQEEFPWNTVTGTWIPTTDGTVSPDVEPENEFQANGSVEGNWDWIDILSTTDEVKTNFVPRFKADFDRFYAAKAEDSGTTYVCFTPTSTQFQQEAANKCCTGATCTRETPVFVEGANADVLCTTVDGVIDPDNYICVP